MITRRSMMMTKSITTSNNAPRGVSSVSLSSLLVNLVKEYTNDTKEKVWTRSDYQQQQHNTHSFKGWKICNNSDNSISYRTYRMWTLLAYYLKHVSHYMSWVRKYNNTKAPFDNFQRRTMREKYVN
jgi:hypothetical protein